MGARGLERGLDWGVGGLGVAGLGTIDRGELMLSTGKWRWDGRVRRRWPIDADESEVGTCMGDVHARGGWICTTGEHVSFVWMLLQGWCASCNLI